MVGGNPPGATTQATPRKRDIQQPRQFGGAWSAAIRRVRRRKPHQENVTSSNHANPPTTAAKSIYIMSRILRGKSYHFGSRSKKQPAATSKSRQGRSSGRFYEGGRTARPGGFTTGRPGGWAVLRGGTDGSGWAFPARKAHKTTGTAHKTTENQRPAAPTGTTDRPDPGRHGAPPGNADRHPNRPLLLPCLPQWQLLQHFLTLRQPCFVSGKTWKNLYNSRQ